MDLAWIILSYFVCHCGFFLCSVSRLFSCDFCHLLLPSCPCYHLFSTTNPSCFLPTLSHDLWIHVFVAGSSPIITIRTNCICFSYYEPDTTWLWCTTINQKKPDQARNFKTRKILFMSNCVGLFVLGLARTGLIFTRIQQGAQPGGLTQPQPGQTEPGIPYHVPSCWVPVRGGRPRGAFVASCSQNQNIILLNSKFLKILKWKIAHEILLYCG